MYEGIVQAHEKLQPMLDLIDRMVEEIGKEKFSYEHAAFDDELFETLVANDFEAMEYCMDTDDKNVREARVNEWVTAMQEKYEAEHPDMNKIDICEEVIWQPAPKFYMRPSWGLKILYRGREKRPRKHHHRKTETE
jgi:polyribonucleotide nucleotidyltransferase